MTPSHHWSRTRRETLSLLTALGTLAGAALTGAAPADAATGTGTGTGTAIASGVVYRQYDLTAGPV